MNFLSDKGKGKESQLVAVCRCSLDCISCLFTSWNRSIEKPDIYSLDCRALCQPFLCPHIKSKQDCSSHAEITVESDSSILSQQHALLASELLVVDWKMR